MGSSSTSWKVRVIVGSRDVESLPEVASRFLGPSQGAAIHEFGSGNINKTYLVTPTGGTAEPFILQRLNTHVFQRPDLVMRNIRSISLHLERTAERAAAACERRWEVPRILPTSEGSDHWRSKDGAFWRALRFIPNARTVDAVRDPALASEVGFALGTFHASLSDLPVADLADTLPGFHVAPNYLAHYDQVLGANRWPQSPEEDWCIQFLAERRHWIPVLERAREQGILRPRPIHGDPKVNNVLFDESTGHAVAMIDLDTVKPGLVHYDIGDCLRSACNPDGEETERWQDVRFDPELGKAVLKGYLEVARGFFDAADFDFIPESVRLLACELGLRFFTDHLEGDVYFKVTRRGHNLSRALVQFKLAQSIEERFDELKAIVQALR
ncbi:MAG: phosphotransferase [Cyanobacteria bacterium REEB65]|nr:phosphotransferase [Cyanobacteria bacterium REEB65]